jgi:hypothetical protein
MSHPSMGCVFNHSLVYIPDCRSWSRSGHVYTCSCTCIAWCDQITAPRTKLRKSIERPQLQTNLRMNHTQSPYRVHVQG